MKSVSGRGFLALVCSIRDPVEGNGQPAAHPGLTSQDMCAALGTGSQHRGGAGHRGRVKFMHQKVTFSGTRGEVDVH